jgi:hypothetical protein
MGRLPQPDWSTIQCAARTRAPPMGRSPQQQCAARARATQCAVHPGRIGPGFNARRVHAPPQWAVQVDFARTLVAIFLIIAFLLS